MTSLNNLSLTHLFEMQNSLQNQTRPRLRPHEIWWAQHRAWKHLSSTPLSMTANAQYVAITCPGMSPALVVRALQKFRTDPNIGPGRATGLELFISTIYLCSCPLR